MAIALLDERPHGWLVASASGSLTLAEILSFMQTARAADANRMVPLLVDARGATTDMPDIAVERAVALVQQAIRRGPRGHVAIVADTDRLYDWMCRYETRCNEIGVRLVRVFRERPDAERWLEAVSAARHFR